MSIAQSARLLAASANAQSHIEDNHAADWQWRRM